jgi:hypothetical protein
VDLLLLLEQDLVDYSMLYVEYVLYFYPVDLLLLLEQNLVNCFDCVAVHYAVDYGI